MNDSSPEILVLESQDILSEGERISRFIHSLSEERYTFALGEEEISRSEKMLVAVGEDGSWLGVTGWRRFWWGGIFYLVVHRDHQRKGLGKRLTLELVKTVPSNMLLLLRVDRSNSRARKLYSDAGFSTLRRGKNHVFMAFKNPLSLLLGIPMKVGLLVRSLWNPG